MTLGMMRAFCSRSRLLTMQPRQAIKVLGLPRRWQSSTGGDTTTPKRVWEEPMPADQYARMRDILAAPSPVNAEAGMTEGVLVPMFKEDGFNPKWGIHRFLGNAGVVIDTDPDDTTGKLKVMICGHADKIRMQVRHISADGKVWINSDSFLPCTLIGNKVNCFSNDPADLDKFRKIPGTVEALGAIHFAPPTFRSGDKGIKPDNLYLELGIYGSDGKKQVEDLGIRPGQSILLDRVIEPCIGPNTFSGAYLDNGLGCFVAEEVARFLDPKVYENIRVLYAFAAHEEIGRFGSRVLVESLRPDVLVAVDVNHDYEAAPIGKEAKNPPLELGKGFTLGHGSIASSEITTLFEKAALSRGIPHQHDVRGRDTGTDAMAGVLSGVDCAAITLGFPIRNMHTVSELGHTGDVLATIEVIKAALEDMSEQRLDQQRLKTSHVRLDQATDLQTNSKPDKPKV
eukprot:m.36133 g.36133  ORF g.36133 m.36133 type:complete len:455 (-) comp17264_c2_seq1:131-1495(-)